MARMWTDFWQNVRLCGQQRGRLVGLVLCILFIQSACSVPKLGGAGALTDPLVGSGGSEGSEKPATPSATAYILARQRITPTPSATAKNTAINSATPTPVTPSPNPTLTNTPRPSFTPTREPEFRLCSPIAANTLEELPKIVSSPYKPPKERSDERHHGVDFSYHRWKNRGSILGVGVRAALAGRVAAALEETYPFGNLVMVETGAEALPPGLIEVLEIPPGESLYLLYAHLDQPPLVALGDEVPACQLLGAVGRSGNTQVAHLHFETRIGPPGATFLGMSRFVEGVTPMEVANYNLWRVSGTFEHFDPMLLLSYDGENGN